MKKCKALGPWFQSRLRTLSTRSDVHRIVGSSKVCVRVRGSELRMTLAKEASCGGGVEVVRKWTGSIYGGLGGLIWKKESAGEFRRRSRVNISPRFLSSQTLKNFHNAI